MCVIFTIVSESHAKRFSHSWSFFFTGRHWLFTALLVRVRASWNVPGGLTKTLAHVTGQIAIKRPQPAPTSCPSEQKTISSTAEWFPLTSSLGTRSWSSFTLPSIAVCCSLACSSSALPKISRFALNIKAQLLKLSPPTQDPTHVCLIASGLIYWGNLKIWFNA